jgi:UDP:flavonoid glycosyltransferase YjiC (YdhE family)
VVVARSAPHEQVFRQATAVITHAGMGTVSRALAHGLPLLCMPMGRDQEDIAARVQWHGAGLRVGAKTPVRALESSIRTLLNDESLRDGALRLRSAIDADLAGDRAVAELEALAGVDDARSASSPRRLAGG